VISSGGLYDMFLAKYRGADAAHLWSKAFGNSSANLGWAVATDDADNVIVLGEFAGEIDFGGTPLSTATFGRFAAKFSSLGGHLWSREVEARDDVSTLPNGDLLVTTPGGVSRLAAATGNDVSAWSVTGAVEPSLATIGGAAILAGRFDGELVFDSGSFNTAGGFDAFLLLMTP